MRGTEQEILDDESFADPEEALADAENDGDEEIDSCEAFESGDEERFQGFSFRGSGGLVLEDESAGAGNVDDQNIDEDVDSPAEDFEGLGSDSEDDHKDLNDLSGGSDSEGSEDPKERERDSTSISDEPINQNEDERAMLRKMMAEEQKTVAASLSKAAKADHDKGRAIKCQRTTFDALLNTRIKLQKALIATNSMSPATTASNEDTKAIQAAETAALSLWNNISSLRSSLHSPSTTGHPVSATPTTPSPDLWSSMQSHEATILPLRRTTLTKWSERTNPNSTLPRTSKFSTTTTQQPLTSILDTHLTGPSLQKLLLKTRTPRSCAPVQASSARTTTTTTIADADIYDDADFYTLLLRELVDQRMTDSANPHNSAAGMNGTSLVLPSQRSLKVKKPVDPKASKGRKLRYTVHEKLQNFMAPEDRGTWGERQIGELFGSLLGRRVRLDEGGEGSEGDEDEMEGVQDGGGLRLFG